MYGRVIWRAAIVGFALLVCALARAPEASAQLDQWGFWENGVTEHWWLSSSDFTAEDATQAVARWDKVGAVKDAKTWAGDYFRGGETHGTYMRWSPDAGFVIAHVNKCEARVTGLIYGRVEATPTLVQFFPELDKVPHGGHHGGGAQHAAEPRTVIRFVPVEWRGERLLVAESEMADFGDYAAGLGEYNDTAVGLMALGYDPFFMHSYSAGTWDGRGTPVVPPGYERFIKKPIAARVTAVGQRVLWRDDTNAPASYVHESRTYVTINAGTEHGVKDRMVFRVVRPAEGDTVFVVRAGRRTSTAVVVRHPDEHGAETFYDSESREKRHSKVSVGWRLTTSLF